MVYLVPSTFSSSTILVTYLLFKVNITILNLLYHVDFCRKQQEIICIKLDSLYYEAQGGVKRDS